MNPEDEEAVYMVHTRELYVLQKTIYKIGRSHHIDSRIKQYPKGSKIMCIVNCKNSVICEKELIKIFKAKFKQRTDYGTEYFEGDKDLMIREIFNVIDKQNTIYKKANGGGSVVAGSDVVGEGGSGNDIASLISENNKSGTDIGSLISGTDLVIKKEDLVVKYKDRTCPNCSIKFKYPSRLKTHFEISIHCKKTVDEIDNYFKFNTKYIVTIKCKYCNKEFSRKDSLNRHQKSINCVKT
jgi:hypothetical protein